MCSSVMFLYCYVHINEKRTCENLSIEEKRVRTLTKHIQQLNRSLFTINVQQLKQAKSYSQNIAKCNSKDLAMTPTTTNKFTTTSIQKHYRCTLIIQYQSELHMDKVEQKIQSQVANRLKTYALNCWLLNSEIFYTKK